MSNEFIKKLLKGLNKKLSTNFYSKEFDCSCDSCEQTIINMVHVARLEQLRRELDRPIKITSGYRCADHNKAVGGVPSSQHMLGNATDILFLIKNEHDELRFKRIFPCVIAYDTFTHVDSRPGRKIFIDKRKKINTVN